MRIAPVLFSGLAVLAMLAAAAPPALAADTLAGPVEARVVRVIDGDTFVAEARIWPGQTLTVGVRIRGIDAPELRGGCEAEKTAAEETRAALVALIGDDPVRITNIGGGKYYGRVLADVTTGGGRSVADSLLERALVDAYDGGGRVSLCP